MPANWIGDALEPRLADHRMVHLEEEAAAGDLRVVVVEVLGGLHRAGRDAGGLQQRASARGGPLRGSSAAIASSSASWLAKRAAWLAKRSSAVQAGSPDRVGEARPLLVVEHGDGDPAVLAAARVDAVRRGVRMLQPVAGGIVAARG